MVESHFNEAREYKQSRPTYSTILNTFVTYIIEIMQKNNYNRRSQVLD